MKDDNKLHGFESSVLKQPLAIKIPDRDEVDSAFEDNIIKLNTIDDYIMTVALIALIPAQRIVGALSAKNRRTLLYEVYDYVVEQNPAILPQLKVINGGRE